MSKFYELCKQVDSYLTEQDGSNLPSFDEAQPGEAVQQDVTIDPTTDTEVRDVSNEKIRELIQTMVNFFKDGNSLKPEQVNEISSKIPAEINAENSQMAVDQLMSIFQTSDFPKETNTFE
jgi:hypothetical protein